MNILITAPSLNPALNVNGISTVVQTIIQNNEKHTYFHYLLGRPDKKQNKLLWLLQLIKQLVLFPVALKKNKIELVHQNLPFDMKGVLREYPINIWSRFFRVSVLLHIHGGLFMTQGTTSKFFQKLSRSLFQHANQVIVLSELEQNVLHEKFGYSKAVVLSNSIDTAIYKSDQIKRWKDKPTLLYLGRIEKNKGIYELVAALKLLKNEFDFRFELCGAGPMKDYCVETCHKMLGIDFEYIGVVSGEEKIHIIKRSHLFLLPSYFEGLPMALLETMAAGVVPIVTNVGSMQHIIKHGINGLLVEKQNPQDLYEKLKLIISDRELYDYLAANATKTIKENFDIKNYIIQLNELYKAASTK